MLSETLSASPLEYYAQPGPVTDPMENDSLQNAELIDRLARLSVGGDEAIAELRALYASAPRLRVPEGWTS